jgi:hypothetical protein
MMRTWMALALWSVTLLISCGLEPAWSYPLDGFLRTGIRRLEGYRNAQQDAKARKLPAGALLATSDIQLHLAASNPTWDVTDEWKDPLLQEAIASIFAGRDASNAVAVIDISDPNDVAWAGLREHDTYSPGSVGKIL